MINYSINKNEVEKAEDLIQFYFKSHGQDLILYYHFLSVIDEIKEDLKHD